MKDKCFWSIEEAFEARLRDLEKIDKSCRLSLILEYLAICLKISQETCLNVFFDWAPHVNLISMRIDTGPGVDYGDEHYLIRDNFYTSGSLFKGEWFIKNKIDLLKRVAVEKGISKEKLRELKKTGYRIEKLNSNNQ